MISEYTLKHIKLCRFLNFFLEGTCPLSIQYTERSNYLSGLQYRYVYIRDEKF